MRIFLLSFSTIVLSITAWGQDQLHLRNQDSIPAHSHRDFSISGSPNLLFNTPNGTQFAGGIKLRVFLGKRFSFDSDLVIGRDYGHGGPGLIGIPLWLIFLGTNGLSTNEESTFAGVLLAVTSMILSAEHLAYHIPARSTLDVSPYISVLRYKASYEFGYYSNPGFAGEQLSFTLGLELNKYFKRFVLSPYAEWNIGYKDHLSGFNTGVYCGYYFRAK